MQENYKQLIELISKNANIPKEEIEKRVEAKQAKLSGLISKEGAAQIIASELGVNLEKQIVKISQIVPGMRKINIIGKIITLFPVREYNKNGRSGRIGSFILADETSNIRTVLWDENHINLISTGELEEGKSVEITNASLRNGELHLSSFSEIKISEKLIENVVTEKPVLKKPLSKINPNESISSRAFIVQIFEPRFFEICPECRRKVNELGECQIHGKVTPERRALLNFVIDDGTETLRAVMFSENLEKIMPLTELEDSEKFALRKKELLGKELIIYGDVRKNQLFGNKEIIISKFKEIDLNQLITELESNN